jgi:hypothetical protein
MVGKTCIHGNDVASIESARGVDTCCNREGYIQHPQHIYRIDFVEVVDSQFQSWADLSFVNGTGVSELPQTRQRSIVGD